MANVCKKCGNNLYGNKTKCPFCGEPIRSSGSSLHTRTTVKNNSSNFNKPKPSGVSDYYEPNTNKISTTDDTGGSGWGLLGFCIPLVGIIMYFIWKDEKPHNAQALLNGALIAIVLGFVLNLFVGCASLL